MKKELSFHAVSESQMGQSLPFCEYSLGVAVVLLESIPLSYARNVAPWLMKEHSTNPLLLCFLRPPMFSAYILRIIVWFLTSNTRAHQVNLMFHDIGRACP